MERFKQKVLTRLEKLGLNQTELAERMGVSKQQVGRWLDENFPRIDSLLLLAEHLHTTVDYLCNDNQKEPPSMGSITAETQDELIVEIIRELELDRAQVRAQLYALGRKKRRDEEKRTSP